MLLLTATTDKLQLLTASAVTVDVHASVMDHTIATDNVEGVRQNTAITTAATTDIVAAPASGVTRNVKTLHIRNKHASTAVDVTVIYDQSGTDFELFKATLLAGETLEYIEGVGFFVTTGTSAVLFRETRRVAGADVVNATTSFIDITGLSFAVKSGKHYRLHACLWHVENAATTGPRFGTNGPTMTNMRLGIQDVVVAGVDTSTLRSGGVATAHDTSSVGLSLSGSTVIVPCWMTGYFNPSADGTLILRVQSEIAVAAGVTVKIGSWADLEELNN